MWLLEPELACRAALDREWQMLLSADEQQRCEALRSARLQREFVVAHALVRLVLSRYARVEPAAWRFGRTCFGRRIIANGGYAHVCFSLSHTPGLVAVAVASHTDVGVDVEDTRRPVEAMAVAAGCFAAAEVAGRAELPPAERQDQFFCLWALKEANLKPRGVGLSGSLDTIAFSIDRHSVAGLGRQLNRWQFGLLAHTPHCRLAVAL